jgi:hypothetical protein
LSIVLAASLSHRCAFLSADGQRVLPMDAPGVP